MEIQPKVLIVDDKKDIRTFIKLTIKKENNYIFVEAANGKEAIEKAFETNPHIILIDAVMPEMDGFEAIDILRKDERTKNTPILMISSLDSKDDKVKALKSGISDFIAKPFDKTELNIRVNSLLTLHLKYLKEEEKLREINADLEAKVNQKLEKRLTDIRLASIGQLATNITHELNTPVTYMKTNLEMLTYDIENDNDPVSLKQNITRSIATMEKGLDRLKGIINTTRELSAKSENKKELQNVYETIIICSKMVNVKAKTLCKIYINDSLFELDMDQNKEVFNAEIFRQKLEQVWIIILNNACDEFERSPLPFDERKIDIKLYYENEKLIVEFRDNAAGGIDEKILPKIFEPFVSSKENSGIGVGLNIAHEIVELHGGEIKAYNHNGYAVFKILL